MGLLKCTIERRVPPDMAIDTLVEAVECEVSILKTKVLRGK